MSFDLDKEILELDKEINVEDNQLNDLNKLYNQFPKNNYINNKKGEKNIKDTLKSLNNIASIITDIDKIEESPNPTDKLFLLSSLFKQEKISNVFIKKNIINKLISEDILKIIEESFLNIKYPIFNGKILMTAYDQLIIDNKSDLEIISSYFELFSCLVTDFYKEFANYGSVNDLIIQNNENNYSNKIKFLEILPEIIFKKIFVTIFQESKDNDIYMQKEEGKLYYDKLSKNEKKLLNLFENLILYIDKAITNTSELISLIANQMEINEEKNKINLNKNIMIKYILNNLMEKLILFLISEKSNLEINNNTSILLMILLIHKTNEQMNEYNNNYQYDSLKNISLYDFIKYYISNTSTEENIIKGQKKFNENIINKLKEKIQENNYELNKTEDIVENINLMVKDIISIFEVFRSYKIIKELLMSSCKEILNIFKTIYKAKIDFLFNKNNTISIEHILFITNLLYNIDLTLNNEFDSFLARINLFEENYKNTIAKELNNFIQETKELYNDFKIALLSKIKFEQLINLYNYKNLKEGNDLNDIKKAFNEINEYYNKIKTVLDNIQANKILVKSIINDVAKNFIKELTLIVLNNIEKGDLEENNLDILIEKTKLFAENNFMNEDNVDDDIKKDIFKLNSYLDNLYLNKK